MGGSEMPLISLIIVSWILSIGLVASATNHSLIPQVLPVDSAIPLRVDTVVNHFNSRKSGGIIFEERKEELQICKVNRKAYWVIKKLSDVYYIPKSYKYKNKVVLSDRLASYLRDTYGERMNR